MLEYLVRRDVDRLDDFANSAFLDQHARVDSRRYFEALAVHDRVDAFGFGYRLAYFGELFERRDARLVGEKVLAELHDPHAEWRAFTCDLRAKYKLDGWVVQ